MESTSKVSVPILTEHSFSRWKGQVRNVLEADELFGIVDGSEVMPAAAQIEARKAWKKKDAKARAILSSSLDDLHDSFVRGCGTSKDMMDKLVQMYERTSAGRKYTAWQELFDMTWDEDVPAASFLARINAISHKLESLDEKPKDSILIGKVLSSLPAKLESFKQSWNLTKTGDAVTFADLQTSLLNAELALRDKVEPADKDGVAFFGKKQRRVPAVKKQGDKKDVRCFNCDEKGTLQAGLPAAQAGKSSIRDWVRVLCRHGCELESMDRRLRSLQAPDRKPVMVLAVHAGKRRTDSDRGRNAYAGRGNWSSGRASVQWEAVDLQLPGRRPLRARDGRRQPLLFGSCNLSWARCHACRQGHHP